MSKSVLLVDDLQMLLKIESDFFKESAINILTAMDGVEALEVMTAVKPDIVFMDLQMPRMDGAICCKIMRSNSLLRDIPVVMVTSTSSPIDRDICFAAGCNHLISKPASRDDFLKIARLYIPAIERRQRRHKYRHKCLIYHHDLVIESFLLDLSIDGAFIATDSLEKPPPILKISFTFPNESSRIECHSRVVWLNDKDATRPRGFGIKFVHMSKEDKSLLSRLIDSRP